ncbi:MAG: flagellar hook-basal body complex protein FliE [Pseudomonadota bacterium]
MDISSTFAARGYAATRIATEPEVAGESLTSVASDFAQTLQDREVEAVDALASQPDPLSLVQALAETQLAVETAVTVRDRVVEAYQEILRMPV